MIKLSLNSFLGISQKIDNSTPSIFIQIIGGHAVGKSSLAGHIRDNFKHNITVLGKYSHSQTTHGLLTGGMDMYGKTTKERLDAIKAAFLSSIPVVVAEGAMINAWDPFITTYQELQQTRKREVYIVHLYASMEKVCERVEKRSKGKTTAANHLKNYQGKLTHAQNLFDKIQETATFHKVQFCTDSDFDTPYAYLAKLISEVLTKCAAS